MNTSPRENGLSLSVLWKLFIKNIFSVFYFTIVGLILALVYTQFLVTPNFSASGNIENVGAVSSALMPTIVTIAKEQETLDLVVERMEVVEEEQAAKISEIRSNLIVGTYNTTTLKINVSYSGSVQTEVSSVVNYVIEVSIEKFIERNPTLEGKVKKQSDPIVASPTGISSNIIYVGFTVLGAGLGALIGIAGDLINRKILFEDDIQEYNLPYHTINLKRISKDQPIIEADAFKEGTLILQDKLEGAARRSKAKVIGVSNLGNEVFNPLAPLFAENLNEVGLKTLVIDLNLESPFIHLFYNLETKVNITNILTEEKIEPIKIKDKLFVIPAAKYAYPARFLKNERLSKLIREFALDFDYIFINVPATDYYASLLFNFKIIDMLLVNTSVEVTKMKTLDKYISDVEPEHRSKIFLNAIDSRVKKDYLSFLQKKKTVKN